MGRGDLANFIGLRAIRYDVVGLICMLYMYCYEWYFGDLVKLCLTVVDFNVSGTSDDRGKVKA